MSTVKTIILTECNDHEGETWRFYVAHTDLLERAVRQLARRDEDSYTVDVQERDWAELQRVADEAGSGYMAFYNLITDPINVESMIERENDEPLYKGGLMNFVIKPTKKAKRKPRKARP